MTRQQFLLRYTLFAVLATVANLLTQRLVLHWGDTGLVFVLALGIGTLVGLVIKYVLDKRWIFEDLTKGVQAQSRQFALYATMGLITTVIFWGTETTFWLIWGTDLMRELGAVIGLMIGYTAKYWLDRRFVFASPHTGVVS